MNRIAMAGAGLCAALLGASVFAGCGNKVPALAQDVLLAAGLALWAVYETRRNGWTGVVRALPVPAVGLAIAALMSAACAANMREAATETAQIVAFVLLTGAARSLAAAEPRAARQTLAAVGLFAAVVAAHAFWQFARNCTATGGLFVNRHVLTGWLCAAVPLACAFLWDRGRTGTILCGLLCAAAAATVLPFGWIAMLAGILVAAFCLPDRRRALWPVVGVCAGIAIAAIISPADMADRVRAVSLVDAGKTGATARVLEWKAAANMLCANPVVGVGVGNYQTRIGEYYGLLPKEAPLEADSQNGWLLVGGTLGLAGLAALVWLFAHSIGVGEKKNDLSRAWTREAAGAAGALTAWCILNLFTNILRRETGPFVMVAIGFLPVLRAHAAAAAAPAGAQQARTATAAAVAVCLSALLVLCATVHRTAERPVVLTFEAEDMIDIRPPMRVTDDRLASGLKALSIPLGAGQGYWKQAGGSAALPIRLARDGDYVVWLRCLWKGGCENAVYLRVDGGRKIVAGNDAIFGEWHWVRAGPFALQTGAHRLELSNHSHGIAVDKMEIASDPDYRPSGYGSEVPTFFDGFGGCDGQNRGSWTDVSGKWRVVDDSAGNARATGSTFAHAGRGTGLAVAHQIRWRECAMETYFMSAGTGAVGMVFDYVSPTHYRRAEWVGCDAAPTGGALRVFAVSNGVERLLAQAGRGYGPDAWRVLGVRRAQDHVTVSVDGEPVLTAPGVACEPGCVGLYTRGNDFVYFDNVKVVKSGTADAPRAPPGDGGGSNDVSLLDLDGVRLRVEYVTVGTQAVPVCLVRQEPRSNAAGPALIELHGWGDAKSAKPRRPTPRPAARGYLEVHPDLRGHGARREPGFEEQCRDNFPKTAMRVIAQSAEDVSAVVDFLQSRRDLAVTRIGVVGYSMGGVVACLAMAREPRIAAAACVNAGVCNFQAAAPKTSYASLQGWKTDVSRQVDDELRALWREWDPLFHPERFAGRPLFLMGNRQDRIVDTETLVALHRALLPLYGGDTNRLCLIVDEKTGAGVDVPPMVSHLPDLENLRQVDAFMDRWLKTGDGAAPAPSARVGAP